MFGELSMIQDPTKNFTSPLKLDASNLEDTVDQDFRKLAMNPDQSMNDSAAYDLFLTLSN